MVHDSPKPARDPQDIDFKQKTTPHPMVSLATRPKQPLHPWQGSNVYRVSPIPIPIYKKPKKE